MSVKVSWNKTLRLPKSSFPARPSAHLREHYLKQCTDDLYRWQAQHRPGGFVLHDGPPYANGHLHAGHALNKILKDIIVRSKIQRNQRVCYVPGWDCHGLPIELKALEAAAAKQARRRAAGGDDGGGGGSDGGSGGGEPTADRQPTVLSTPAAIRKAARALASKTLLAQMRAFRSYGVMADWDSRWTTMDRQYELRQLRLFQKMAAAGLIYRRFKPVYWSPSSRTALAEAELEYRNDHVSTAAYVRFRILEEDYCKLGPELKDFPGRMYAVIWTTMPWTLPANQAISVNAKIEYCVVRVGPDAFIFGRNRLEKAGSIVFGGTGGAAHVSRPRVEPICTVPGNMLHGLRYVNPLHGEGAGSHHAIVTADFVTESTGTGLVHSAPGHGFDDYLLVNKWPHLNISIASPVDDEGRLTSDAYPCDPARLEGVPVLDGGAAAVLDLMGSDVLHVHKHMHRYPYDWRTKKPIIIRATAQWFADVASIKDQALAALKHVHFVPETGKNRLEAFVKSRSEWCISRQRAWGLPIPALYDEIGEAIMTDESIGHIINVIAERGTDAWWFDGADDPAWIPEPLRDSKRTYRRGRDTMDVWFDSGSSWTQMGNEQADVYLEGSDQHRGWFQASLLTRVAALAANHSASGTSSKSTARMAPFRTLVTHGFTLDQEGKKMSKSLGNVISAEQIMDGSLLPSVKSKKGGNDTSASDTKDVLGPDALRLWAAGSDFTADVVLGAPVLRSVHQSLLKYRAIIKMLTGCLREPPAGTPSTEDGDPPAPPLTTLDRIALLQLDDTMREVGRHYDALEFNKAIGRVNHWVVNDLSALYLDAAKDRLYCGDGGGVIEPLLWGLLRMLAPVCPLLVEEAWDHVPAWIKEGKAGTPAQHPLRQLYHAPLKLGASLPATGEPGDKGEQQLSDEELRAVMPLLTRIHTAIKAALEQARAEKKLGQSLQCSTKIDLGEGLKGKGQTATMDSGPGTEAVAQKTPPPMACDLLRRLGEEELASIFVVSSVELVKSIEEVAGKEAGSQEETEEWAFRQDFALVRDGATGAVQKGSVAVLPPTAAKCPRCWRYVAPKEDVLCARCAVVVGNTCR